LTQPTKDLTEALETLQQVNSIILANAADDARVIIGEGLTEAITQAFGGGDIDKAAEGYRSIAAGFAADLVISIGNVAKISGFALLVS
jgi:hypothetical protein